MEGWKLFLNLNQYGISIMFLWSSCVQPFTLSSPFSLLTPTLPSLQPSSRPWPKIKMRKQSTKGPPVQLVWWLCCGESFLLTCPDSEVSKHQTGRIEAGYNKPIHYARLRGRRYLHKPEMFLTERTGNGCNIEV